MVNDFVIVIEFPSKTELFCENNAFGTPPTAIATVAINQYRTHEASGGVLVSSAAISSTIGAPPPAIPPSAVGTEPPRGSQEIRFATAS